MEAAEFVQKYEKALASQNWLKVAPLISEKATVTFSNGSTFHGKHEIRAAFEKNFSTIKSEKYAIKNIKWLLNEYQIGVYTFDFNWEGIINGTNTKGAGRGTTVIINEKVNWKLLTEHLGPMPKIHET